MKKYKFRYKYLLLMPVMVIAIYLAWHSLSMIYSPMRRPESMVRNHILRHTQIGMSMEEVIEIIENRGNWGNPIINRSNGFLHPTLFVDGPDGSRTRAIIGEQSIQSRHRYSIPLFPDRSIRVFWGFDESGKLIEVYVESWFVL